LAARGGDEPGEVALRCWPVEVQLLPDRCHVDVARPLTEKGSHNVAGQDLRPRKHDDRDREDRHYAHRQALEEEAGHLLRSAEQPLAARRPRPEELSVVGGPGPPTTKEPNC